MKLFYQRLKFRQFFSALRHPLPQQLGLPCLLCGASLHANQPFPTIDRCLEAGDPQPPLVTHVPTAQYWLCQACEQALPWMGTDNCPQCALPTAGGRVCGSCLQHPPAFDRTLSVFRYAFPVNRCLQQFKYAQELAFGEGLMQLGLPPLTRLARNRVDPSTLSHTANVVIAMPMHRARLQARGFHHADFLAHILAKHWGVPLRRDACARVLDTPTQAGLDMKTRTRHLRRAFATQHDWTGQHIWVVDDVMTTGASMHALGRVLKQAGAASVTAVVLARTLKPGQDLD